MMVAINTLVISIQLIGTHKIAVGWSLIFTLNFIKSTGVVVTWVRITNTPT